MKKEKWTWFLTSTTTRRKVWCGQVTDQETTLYCRWSTNYAPFKRTKYKPIRSLEWKEGYSSWSNVNHQIIKHVCRHTQEMPNHHNTKDQILAKKTQYKKSWLTYPSFLQTHEHNKEPKGTTPRRTKFSFIEILLFRVLHANKKTSRGTGLFHIKFEWESLSCFSLCTRIW